MHELAYYMCVVQSGTDIFSFRSLIGFDCYEAGKIEIVDLMASSINLWFDWLLVSQYKAAYNLVNHRQIVRIIIVNCTPHMAGFNERKMISGDMKKIG